MPICSVVGCSNAPGYTNNKNIVSDIKLRFYSIPKVSLKQADETTRKLSEERRRLWKAAINRKNLTEKDWDKTVVCSRHFVDGVKAYIHSRNSPSWLPTLHLGYDTTASEEVSKKRFLRLQARYAQRAFTQNSSSKRKREATKHIPVQGLGDRVTVHVSEKPESNSAYDFHEVDEVGVCGGSQEEDKAEDKVDEKSYVEVQITCDQTEVVLDDTTCIMKEIDVDVLNNREASVQTDISLEQVYESEEVGVQTVLCDNIISSMAFVTVHGEISVQTELTSKDIQRIIDDNIARVIDSTKCQSHSIYDREYYVQDNSKVQYYTGLPSFPVLVVIFQFVLPCMLDGVKSLSKDQELLLCLIKLRMNYHLQDIAYQLNVAFSTVQRSFHRTLGLLVDRLTFLIRWPEREELRVSMPMSFRESFGDKVAVIVDCFELSVEKPSGAANQVHIYSNYKHDHTVKYLIGITPQGTISFISPAWGGRASDKYIIEKSGLLQNLLPGDILMADRGFNIEDEVIFYQAQLKIPNFTHGKKQLHPLEVENTRKIASLRIHVERMIGFVRRKFSILQSTIPIEFLRVKQGDHEPTIDKIIKVCCCLINIHQSIVPNE